MGGFVFLALLLSGCSAASPAPPVSGDPETGTDASPSMPPEQAAGEDAAASGTATFSADGREFAVELTMCSVHDGGADILLSGPATEVGGDATGFLDGDLTTLDARPYGEFRIDIGATGPFASSDEFLSMGDPTGGTILYTPGAASHTISAKAWDEHGNDLGAASIVFTC